MHGAKLSLHSLLIGLQLAGDQPKIFKIFLRGNWARTAPAGTIIGEDHPSAAGSTWASHVYLKITAD